MKLKKKLDLYKNAERKKLIFVDLDGTLLNNEGKITDDTLNYFSALKNKGHKVIINTGRSFRGSINFYQQMKLDTVLINNNGAHVLNPKNKNFAETIITFNVSPILNFLTTKELHSKINFILFETLLGPYYWKNTKLIKRNDWLYTYQLSKKDIIKNKITEISKIKPILKNVRAMMINFNKENISSVSQILKINIDNVKFLDWTKNTFSSIEVNNATINKGTALRHVAKLYGYKKDNIFAFGDNYNDIEMLNYVENNSFLMKNAPKHFLQNTKFKVTLDTNHNDGIVKTLRKYIKI